MSTEQLANMRRNYTRDGLLEEHAHWSRWLYLSSGLPMQLLLSSRQLSLTL